MTHDTTIYNITNDPKDSTLQDAVNTATNWSKANDMKINTSKTKEMLICFSRTDREIPVIEVDGTALERVSSCTLLGIELNDSLD